MGSVVDLITGEHYNAAFIVSLSVSDNDVYASVLGKGDILVYKGASPILALRAKERFAERLFGQQAN